jgi:hypothetical protein
VAEPEDNTTRWILLGVGGFLGCLVCIVMVFVIWRRRRKRRLGKKGAETQRTPIDLNVVRNEKNMNWYSPATNNISIYNKLPSLHNNNPYSTPPNLSGPIYNKVALLNNSNPYNRPPNLLYPLPDPNIGAIRYDWTENGEFKRPKRSLGGPPPVPPNGPPKPVIIPQSPGVITPSYENRRLKTYIRQGEKGPGRKNSQFQGMRG